MLPQNNEQISTLNSEGVQQNETTPAETGGTSLHGEIGAEKTQNPQPKQNDDDNNQPLLVKVTTSKKDENVVNKTGIITELHNVAENADKLTTLADKDEEEFIGGVETAHHAIK